MRGEARSRGGDGDDGGASVKLETSRRLAKAITPACTPAVVRARANDRIRFDVIVESNITSPRSIYTSRLDNAFVMTRGSRDGRARAKRTSAAKFLLALPSPVDAPALAVESR